MSGNKALVLILACSVFVAACLGIRRVLQRCRREFLKGTPFPERWRKVLGTNVRIYNHLPQELKDQLHCHINVFLAEKRFEGCGGLHVTDEIRVTIAALACMLLLNRKTDYYPKLKSILVYPHPYVVEDVDFIGDTRVHGWSFRAGESWTTGAVVVAWDEVTAQASDVGYGHNVVLHEFAHQLDQEDGTGTAGIPVLERGSSYITWARILGKGFRQLREKVEREEADVIDEYGAENEAEFFAVATEAFFEKPVLLRKKHPDLYAELKNYYKLDPAEWV